MPNYFTVTRNPIARAGIIRKLMAKGYALYENNTVSDYFKRWPADSWPVVMVRFDGEFANKPTIDLLQTTIGIPANSVRVSPVKVQYFPESNSPPVVLPDIPAPVFPEAAKYSLDYIKADGSEHNYTISNPIEANKDSITAYAFGRGVRTFKKCRVRRFSKVN